mmetsp:Transcript_21458/g.27786  ORF Transcript_21458/g.27786 Transcript_21458/m.27786 type:complete len:125 (-) Transcript_21458:415-789(-)
MQFMGNIERIKFKALRGSETKKELRDKLLKGNFHAAKKLLQEEKKLDLSYDKLKRSTIDALSANLEDAQIETLCLCGCSLGQLPPKILQKFCLSIAKNTSIKKLILQNNHIDDLAGEVLALAIS